MGRVIKKITMKKSQKESQIMRIMDFGNPCGNSRDSCLNRQPRDPHQNMFR